MTGYANAEKRTSHSVIAIQIQSVNNKKGLDIQLNIPKEIESLEPEIRREIQHGMARGRVALSLQIQQRVKSSASGLSINRKQLKAYKRELDEIAKELGGIPTVSLEYLFKLPGVVADAPSEPIEALQQDVLSLIRSALKKYHQSRQREGQALGQDLQKRAKHLLVQTAQVEKLAPQVVKSHRAALLKRLEDAEVPIDLSDDRLVREIALMADRLDISEEMTRLKAHLNEFLRLLKTSAPHGRHFDFMVQEIGREINTLGNKANDVGVSRISVDMKSELEKMREQVQNIE